MNYYEVAPTKIIRAGQSTLTYASADSLAIGTIVTVEVGKNSLVGVIISTTKKPSYVTKEITSIIDSTPLPKALITSALWLSEYYATPLATVLQTVLPRGINKKRRQLDSSSSSPSRDRTTIVFNDEQKTAITTVMGSDPGTFLLQGITGSGKTEVYKEIAKRTIDAGKSVIVLTPEIGLTPQLVAEFTHGFPTLIMTHSVMTESQRHTAWLDALHSTEPRVIIGPRSALFMPLRDIGAIIIDESHEPSYKQEQSPRYSALRLASILGRHHNAKVIFGSATPSVSERYYAEKAGRPILTMTKSARKHTLLPQTSIVDMTKREQFKQHRFLSDKLLTAIEQNIETGKQTLVFHNRRGSASTTLCDNCGWTAQCPRCFVPLTLHADQYQLRCHICDHSEKVPTQCPVCNHSNIIYKGFGTKLIESELRKKFPKATIARFDADNKAGETMDAQYQSLYDGSIDIAIGTQVVAKGLDLPHLRTVGIVQADNGLALPDFGATERTFQLIAQVVGRVGRNEHETQVIVQTYQPTHSSIVYGAAQNYEAFYAETLIERERAHFPPFTYLLKLTDVYKTESGAVKAAQALARELRDKKHADVTILGPTPAFYERQHDTYRWQLVVRSPQRSHLIDLLAHVPATHWQSELDPFSLI